MEMRKTMLNLLLKINKSILTLFTVFILLVGQTSASDFDLVYQSALKNSTELAIIKANSDEVDAKHNASYSDFLPRAGVESRYETFDSEFEKVSGGTASAFIEWNLFNGFKDIQNKKSLSAESKVAQIQKERFENNFKWLAMSRYTKAQVAQEVVDIYKKVIESNLKNLEALKLRRSSGRISDADYFEFELFDAKLKQDLIAVEVDALAAVAELEAFSGLNSITKLTTQLAPKKLDFESIDLKKEFLSDKSQLRESQLKVEAADARKSLATGGFLPEVSLKATQGSLGLRETLVAPETAFGITAKWELFSGLETLNSRRVAMAQLVKAQTEYENAKIQNLSRVTQLKNQLQSILSRYDFENKNQKSIERYLRSVQDEYRRGVKNSTDLKSALELALETQINRAELRSNYFLARSELQEILGIELKELK